MVIFENGIWYCNYSEEYDYYPGKLKNVLEKNLPSIF